MITVTTRLMPSPFATSGNATALNTAQPSAGARASGGMRVGATIRASGKPHNVKNTEANTNRPSIAGHTGIIGCGLKSPVHDRATRPSLTRVPMMRYPARSVPRQFPATFDCPAMRQR